MYSHSTHSPTHLVHTPRTSSSLLLLLLLQVIIMAFTCAQCGFKSSEVKAGGAVPTYGTEVTLRATGPADLKRDVLKSDSAMVRIPELGLELQCGTLGGQYTTVEGLLQKIESNVRDINPFSYGDSNTLHHSEELSKGRRESMVSLLFYWL
jgi:ZPR1 zinc finger protein